MERSGLLREPAAGRVDFVHRTFQEYLAAKAADGQRRDRPAGRRTPTTTSGGRSWSWRQVHAQPDQVRRTAPRAAETRASPRVTQGASDRWRSHACRRPGGWTRSCGRTSSGWPGGWSRRRRTRPPNRWPGPARCSWTCCGPTRRRTAKRLPRRSGPPPGSAGRPPLRLIGDILAEHVRLVPLAGRRRGDQRLALFKPEQYVAEVLARSWPAEKDLQVPDPAFLEALRLFPELRTHPLRAARSFRPWPAGVHARPGTAEREPHWMQRGPRPEPPAAAFVTETTSSCPLAPGSPGHRSSAPCRGSGPSRWSPRPAQTACLSSRGWTP